MTHTVEEIEKEKVLVAALQTLSDAVHSFDKPDEFADQYLHQAKGLVLDYISRKGVDLSMNEVYVVWFSKTLQNWKALVSTIFPDGLYFEVTYNGAKEESYIDTYVKTDNVRVTDAEYKGEEVE